jgi:ferredoxin
VTRARLEIRIDRARCIGSGVCAVQAPETFDVGDDAKVVLLGGRGPIERIRAAVDGCPTRALELSEPEKEDPSAAS